jgi:inner membrane protein
MNPIAHAELSWLLAQPLQERRHRALVDGLTLLSFPWDRGQAYGELHHLLTHGALAAGGVTALAWTLSRTERLRTAVLACAAFHLHLLCDLLGSGREWPIFYWHPFGEHATAPFAFGWELASWQNMVIAELATAAILVLGVVRGRTIVETLSRRADGEVVKALRDFATRVRSR